MTDSSQTSLSDVVVPEPAVHRRLWSSVRSWISRPSQGTTSQRDESRTAYLDGLRGIASFIVYWGHHEALTHLPSPLDYAYGYEDRHLFATLPIVRIFFVGGQFSIAIFYVISGYVLSTRPLGLIHDGNYLRLGDNLASALFRRWARLFLPLIAVTFVFLNILHLFKIWNSAFNRQETYFLELWHWLSELKKFAFLFSDDITFTYDVYLWSIPLEFRGSIVVYATLLAVSRLRRNIRLFFQLLLFLCFTFTLPSDGWYSALFMSGMILADVDLLCAHSPPLPPFSRLTLNKHIKTCLFVTLFLIGLYLGGVPDQGPLSDSPGWSLLSHLAPVSDADSLDARRFFLLWAAFFLVAGLSRLSLLRRTLESRIAQYLGRISYGLYLVHGPIQWTLGVRLYAAVGMMPIDPEQLDWWRDWMPLPQSGPLGLEPAFLVPQLVLLPFTIWMAEIATVGADQGSVRLAKWVYEWGLWREEEEHEMGQLLRDEP